MIKRKLRQIYLALCHRMYAIGHQQHQDYQKKRFIELFKQQATFNDTVLLDPAARVHNHLHDSTKIKIGDHSFVKCEFQIAGHGGEITIGEYCYLGEDTRIWSAKKIQIGNRVLVSHMVNIIDNNSHPLDAAERHKQFKYIRYHGMPAHQADLNEKPIIIGDDVWIGFNVTILKGVTVGNGAIIGANTVVTQNVAPYTVMVGNPARVIRQLK